MRNLFTLVLFVILQSAIVNLQSYAQAPKKMSYQGGARDAQGNLMVNKDITLRLNIINGVDINTPVYSEVQIASTNAFGLFSLKIGEGQVLQGSMDEIDWGSGDHFIAVEMDAENNGHFVAMGLSQLLSVPYAFYAEKSGTAKDLENMDDIRAIDFGGTFGQTIRHNGSDWEASSLIYSTGNRIGVGTTSPSEKLDVDGNVNVNGNLNLTRQNEITFDSRRALAMDENRNLMQGFQAGNSITTGANNNLIGHQAGKATTTGINNSIIGYQAGLNNTTGDANIFYGYKSGYSNTSGSNNYFIGLQAGYGSTTGVNNVAMGTKAGYSLAGANDNTFVGREAGYNNTGNRNAFIGKDAGRDNTTGFDNTYIGYNANGVDTLENATAIGSGATVSTSNSVVLGNATNVGIGTSAPNDKLHVEGNIRMVDGNQQAGYVPVSDANGTMVWTHPDSTQMRSLWELSGEVIRQNSDLLSLTTPDFVFGSTQLDDNGNSSHDTRMFFDKSKGAFRAGRASGTEWNESNLGLQSTAFGSNNIASGDYSFAIGQNSKATGRLSFAAGKKAYAKSELSIAMGSNVQADSVGSVAVGYRANATHVGSVALGYDISSPSPFEMTVGMFAEEYTPGNSIFPDPNNRLFTIGNGTFSARSNALTILKSGNTGIGTSTPQEKLDVLGSIRMVDGNQQAGYVPVSDANGTMVWTHPDSISITAPSVLADADGDTKIQVEESADENIIRFDLAGTEVLRISKNASGYTLIEAPGSGGNSTFFGQGAGESSTSSLVNTFIGKYAGRNSTSGSFNTTLGYFSGAGLTTGANNTLIGTSSGAFLETGYRNTLVGVEVAFNNLAGGDNTFVGWQAGYNNTGSGSVLLGFKAGRNETGSNKLYIENGPADSANALIYGEFDNDLVAINGILRVNDGGQQAGYVPVSDANGTMTWTNPATVVSEQAWSLTGNSGTTDLTNFIGNTDNVPLSFKVNNQLSGRVSSAGETLFGYQAGKNNTSSRTTAMGHQSLLSNTTGNNNTAVGYRAMRENTTGGANVAIGSSSLFANTTGGNNTVVGNGALSQNTTGYSNTAVGFWALEGMVTGHSNSVIGQEALRSNTTGFKNVAVGRGAGYNNTGHSNIFLGYEAGYNDPGSNKLYIENSDADSTNALIYGEFNNDLLVINGTLKVNDGSQQAGYIAVSDDDGAMTWTAPSIVMPTTLSDADNDTKIHVEESADEDTIRMDIGGAETVVVSTAAVEVKGDNPMVKFYEESGINSRRAAITTNLHADLVAPAWEAEDQKMQLKVSDNTNSGMTTVMTLNGAGNVGIGSNNPGNALDVVGDINTTGKVMENGNELVPVGTVIMFAGSAIPSGWMLCDGGTFNAANYPELNTVLGGNTRPDLIGRFPLGVGNNGTTDAVDHNLGTTGGDERVVLTVGQMPAHTHNVTINFREGQEQGSGNDYSDLGDIGTSETYTTSSRGGDQSHQNMPPFYTLNFIIKAN